MLRAVGACCKGTPWKSLLKYTAVGELDNMKSLLKAGVDPNSLDDGISALEASVRKGNLEAFQLLLKHEASPDTAESEIPIVEIANDLGHDSMVQELIDTGASCRNVAPVQYEIPCNIDKGISEKFLSMARYRNKVFLCPNSLPCT